MQKLFDRSCSPESKSEQDAQPGQLPVEGYPVGREAKAADKGTWAYHHHHHRNDGRAMIGQMLAYDKHMNLVLAECEEFRRVKVSNYATRRFASASHSLQLVY